MFVVLESKNLNPVQGFEHVKEYAGLAAGKPRGFSEHVYLNISNSHTCIPIHICTFRII